MTVIADDSGVHDIAGIMGGEHSGCTEATTDVLLEIAYFDPERIAATGRKLDLTSDARSRFERGVDPAVPRCRARPADRADPARSAAARRREVVRAGAPPMRAPRSSHYDPGAGRAARRRRRSRGRAARDPRARSASPCRATTGQVTAPGWRPDIDGAPDIVEEVVRIHGLDKVASVAAAARRRRRPPDRHARADSSSAACAAPPPRAGSTRRSPGRSCPRPTPMHFAGGQRRRCGCSTTRSART